MYRFFDLFTDPAFFAPTLGSMLMCFASALVGVVVFIRRRSLVGETLSHAAYPGVVIGLFLAATFLPFSNRVIAITVLLGAFLFSLFGLYSVAFLEHRLKIKSDAALCLVLSLFLGLGVLVASRLQITHSLWYQQVQIFLYGQAATMVKAHVILYALLSALLILLVFSGFSYVRAVNFDREFSQTLGMRVQLIDRLSFFLLALAIVVGIRSVGVVLMSGMLIAPAVAARQWTHHLGVMFFLAGLFGLLSGLFGNYFSYVMPHLFLEKGRLTLPTGPAIILVASSIAFVSLLFAPKRGVIHRLWRMARFRMQCRLENALKALWKRGDGAKLSIKRAGPLTLLRLLSEGWVQRLPDGRFGLTRDGEKCAAHIVRLHRLWEVYLADYLGVGEEKVHRNAEEMEHIITPELEKTLTDLLENPKLDPHQQPIPERGARR